MSLDIAQARAQLDSTTFLLGGSRRRAALKALAENPDAAAAAALVDAVERGSPSATGAQEALAASSHASWVQALWSQWIEGRQSWLGRLLLAQLPRHASLIPADRRPAWIASLPMERDVALAIAGLSGGPDTPAGAVPAAFARRVAAEAPDFGAAFMLKVGFSDLVPPTRAWTAEVLRLRADADTGLAAAARKWLAALPNDQQLNDVIADEWLRSKDESLFTLLREQRRLPSDPAREVLLLLLGGDAKAYQALADADGKLLGEALAIAEGPWRERIVETIQKSRDGALADQLRRATLRVQGLDSGLGLRALLASGDEDRIVDATRELRGKELFDLVRRWAGSRQRPNDPRKRAAVDAAVVALKDLPKVEVEPAPKLPDGMDDLLDLWAKHQYTEPEWRQDLQAPDPIIRARALHVGLRDGRLDLDALKAKAGSEDWIERFVAALHGVHPDPANDHVYWVAACAGEDGEAQSAAVQCGPDEYGRAQVRLEGLRKKGTPLARVWAGELAALQAFRALAKTDITLLADDAATERGSLETHGDVSADDLAREFGGGPTPPAPGK